MSTGTDAESRILLEMETEHRALLTLNRPDRLNTLTLDMWPLISQFAEELDANDSARVAILTGTGDRVFSAGLDLAPGKPGSGSASSKPPRRSAAQKNRQTAQLIRRTSSHFTAFENVRIPTIAAINGHCLGAGLELALCCDIRLAVRGATLGLPEVELGAGVDMGGTVRLMKAIGPGHAKRLLYTAERIPAEEALDIGLVQALHNTPDELMSAAREMADRIAAQGPLAVQHCKRSCNHALNRGLVDDLEFEAVSASDSMISEDLVEGVSARREKRDPVYKYR
jgi:enoyl-CoA hydratase/carnithine racemase